MLDVSVQRPKCRKNDLKNIIVAKFLFRLFSKFIGLCPCKAFSRSHKGLYRPDIDQDPVWTGPETTEEFMSDSAEKRALDSKAITDKSAAKAEMEGALAKANTDI